MGDRGDKSRRKYLRELETCRWISYHILCECTSKCMKKEIVFLRRYYYVKDISNTNLNSQTFGDCYWKVERLHKKHVKHWDVYIILYKGWLFKVTLTYSLQLNYIPLPHSITILQCVSPIMFKKSNIYIYMETWQNFSVFSAT
jgi:hypothetical protein